VASTIDQSLLGLPRSGAAAACWGVWPHPCGAASQPAPAPARGAREPAPFGNGPGTSIHTISKQREQSDGPEEEANVYGCTTSKPLDEEEEEEEKEEEEEVEEEEEEEKEEEAAAAEEEEGVRILRSTMSKQQQDAGGGSIVTGPCCLYRRRPLSRGTPRHLPAPPPSRARGSRLRRARGSPRRRLGRIIEPGTYHSPRHRTSHFTNTQGLGTLVGDVAGKAWLMLLDSTWDGMGRTPRHKSSECVRCRCRDESIFC